MPKNPKQQPKSKEQIAAEIKTVQETLRLRKLSQEQFYPFLLENTKSISDARIFLQVLDAVVNGAFNEGRKTTTIGDLKLEEKINKTAPEGTAKKYQDVLVMLKDESLTSYARIAQEFTQVIGGLIQEWETRATLKDLKSPFPEEEK